MTKQSAQSGQPAQTMDAHQRWPAQFRLHARHPPSAKRRPGRTGRARRRRRSPWSRPSRSRWSPAPSCRRLGTVLHQRWQQLRHGAQEGVSRCSTQPCDPSYLGGNTGGVSPPELGDKVSDHAQGMVQTRSGAQAGPSYRPSADRATRGAQRHLEGSARPKNRWQTPDGDRASHAR